jgi:molecular chaperone GrpE
VNREEILRRFETLLDSSLSAEEPPKGIDAEILAVAATEDAADSGDQTGAYELWAAITALTQEIKLQGRAFRDVAEAVQAQPGRIAEEIRAVYREREREIQREAEKGARRQILAALIDLRDRLIRGRDAAAAARVRVKHRNTENWFSGLFSQGSSNSAEETIDAVMKGYELGLERLDQMLEEFNAREIPCNGLPFDARRMNAVDVETSESAPEGMVLEVYRSGYEWDGEVFRPAQVKVSRNTGAKQG